MTKFWRPGDLLVYTQGSSWNGSTLQANFFHNLMPWNPGETLLRTRMAASMVIGNFEVAAGGLTTNLIPMTASRLGWGLYANPTLTATGAPQAMHSNPYDAHWVQHGDMSCKQMYTYVDDDTTHKAVTLWELEDGMSESFAQRGPCEVSGALFLVWDFNNAINQFWAQNNASYQGLIACSVNVHALFETP